MPSLLSPEYISGDRKRGPAEFARRIVQGSTRDSLYRTWAQHGCVRVAEIGVAGGRNSLAMCRAIPGVELLCVDPWRAYADNHRGGPQAQHETNLALAQERLKPYRVTFVRAMSMEAVRDVPDGSLDAVYIDGHHSFDWVMTDLIEWSRRVRPGGWVAGHDIYSFRWAGVVDAVVAYTKAHDITEWSITDEREPSFWWMKP